MAGAGRELEMFDEQTIAKTEPDAAERDLSPGRLAIGSQQHKALFCRTLLDTHNPYKPAVIDWPELDDDARNRLLSLPIWDIAVQTEGKAGIRVQGYADLVSDPLLKQAI